jgi:hypothetical protein
MSKQVLHGPKISSRFQHMRGKGVTQHMRSDSLVDSRPLSRGFDDTLKCPVEYNSNAWSAMDTEQTYRGWMRCFAVTVMPNATDQVGTAEVQSFLTNLAVRERVAASTQRQALNARVFYFREVLKRDLGDLGAYRRASRGPHIPVVLSRPENDRLFAKLDGSSLLMRMSSTSHAGVPSGIGIRVGGATVHSRGVFGLSAP